MTQSRQLINLIVYQISKGKRSTLRNHTEHTLVKGKRKRKEKNRKTEPTPAETKISHRIEKDRQLHQSGPHYINQKGYRQNH